MIISTNAVETELTKILIKTYYLNNYFIYLLLIYEIKREIMTTTTLAIKPIKYEPFYDEELNEYNDKNINQRYASNEYKNAHFICECNNKNNHKTIKYQSLKSHFKTKKHIIYIQNLNKIPIKHNVTIVNNLQNQIKEKDEIIRNLRIINAKQSNDYNKIFYSLEKELNENKILNEKIKILNTKINQLLHIKHNMNETNKTKYE